MKIVRKLSVAWLILHGIFLFSSCINNESIEVGFLIPASKDARWPKDQACMEEAAVKMGIKLTTLSAENNENLQIQQAKDLVDKGVDVLIVVAVNSNTAAAIVRYAHEFDVAVIAYDRLIKNSDLDYLVTFDNKKVGQMMTEYAVQKKPTGNYVLLWGDAGDINAQIIRESQEDYLKKYIENGRINILFRGFVENWDKENAVFLMNSVLSFNDKPIDAIITSYDGIAMGAILALEKAKCENKIIITGQDAEQRALEAILQNKMSMTINKPISDIANKSLELACNLIKNKKEIEISGYVFNGRKDVPMILLTPILVSSENILSEIKSGSLQSYKSLIQE